MNRRLNLNVNSLRLHEAKFWSLSLISSFNRLQLIKTRDRKICCWACLFALSILTWRKRPDRPLKLLVIAFCAYCGFTETHFIKSIKNRILLFLTSGGGGVGSGLSKVAHSIVKPDIWLDWSDSKAIVKLFPASSTQLSQPSCLHARYPLPFFFLGQSVLENRFNPVVPSWNALLLGPLTPKDDFFRLSDPPQIRATGLRHAPDLGMGPLKMWSLSSPQYWSYSISA